MVCLITLDERFSWDGVDLLLSTGGPKHIVVAVLASLCARGHEVRWECSYVNIHARIEAIVDGAIESSNDTDNLGITTISGMHS